MKNLYTIGEVSKLKEITIKALRYYNKVGILIPRYIDENTGYRYYSVDQFIYIDIIKACRTLGTSIVDLQEIFKDCDTDKLLELLKLKRREAEENIIKMQDIISNIDMINTGVEKSKEILNNNKMSIKYFDKRYIAILPCEETGPLGEVIYYSKLDKVIADKNLKMSMERGIIYDFNEDYDIKPRYVFNGIEDNGDLENKYDIKILPKGRYLTLVYNTENEDKSIKKIVDYIKEYNLNIKNIIEFELLNDLFNIESYNCQIQVFIDNDDLCL